MPTMDSASTPTSRTVIFDRPPPSAQRLGFAVTTGRPYPARLLDSDLRTYEIADDRGTPLRLSLYGRTLTNGGYWHLREDEDQIAANT